MLSETRFEKKANIQAKQKQNRKTEVQLHQEMRRERVSRDLSYVEYVELMLWEE